MINKKNVYIKVYSSSFYNLCEFEKTNFKEFLEITNFLIDLLEKDDFLIWNWFLQQKDEELKSNIYQIFENNVPDLWFRLILVMANDNHFFLFYEVLKGIKHFIYRKLNIKKGIIYSVIPLKDQQLKLIKTKLEKKITSKLKLINLLDHQLIAGIRLELEDMIIDNSLKKRIIDLKKAIKKEN